MIVSSQFGLESSDLELFLTLLRSGTQIVQVPLVVEHDVHESVVLLRLLEKTGKLQAGLHKSDIEEPEVEQRGGAGEPQEPVFESGVEPIVVPAVVPPDVVDQVDEEVDHA